MHVSLADTLRERYADRHAAWTPDGATWREGGDEHALIVVDGDLDAETVMDAHLRALRTGARVHLAHSGSASAAARRTAARFGIDLDEVRPPEPAPPAREEPSLPWAGPAPDLPAPPPAPEASLMPWNAPGLVVAPSAPPPEVAHEDSAMPWDLSLSEPEPEPVHVEPLERMAMPWNLVEEQHEIISAGRSHRHAPTRPTQTSPDWGLPWPRPVAPTGGLSIHDPKVWHAQERIAQVREDLQKAGAPSFGAARPEGSVWLKRLHEFP